MSSSTGPWRPLGNETGDDGVPSPKGSAVLFLDPPFVDDGRFVHFSWQGENFKIRDFVAGRWRREGPDLRIASDVWRAAKERRLCRGDLRVPVSDAEFWGPKLKELTESRRKGGRR